jgi:signal transduction histidine kinase
VNRPSVAVPASDTSGQVQKPGAYSPGRGMILARAVWIFVAICALSVFALGIRAEFATLQTLCLADSCKTGQLPAGALDSLRGLGLSLDFYAGFAAGLDVMFAVVYCATSALILWRRTADRMALFASLTLLVFGTATFPNAVDLLGVVHPAWWIPTVVLGSVGSVCMSLFLYLFPDGRFVPRWTIWIAFGGIIWQVIEYLLPGWTSGVWPTRIGNVVWSAFLAVAVYAQVYRYRRVSDALQRQQTKWVVSGMSTALLVLLVTVLSLSSLAPASPRALATLMAGNVIYNLAMLLIPLSIGIAVLRYRLWDIDQIINRTLVYGALTAGVIGLYVLVVGGIGVVLQVEGNLLISILAAGLVAVLFQPLRERLQRAVNHLMYGERDDPYSVLSQLGRRLEARLAPETALSTIVETVAEALKLPYAAISLEQDEEFVMAAEHGDPVDEPIVLPLSYQIAPVGRLILAPRGPGESFSSSEMKLLEDLARQAAVTVYAARLTADLQKSREHLVTAREEERRRLRRDLHDGLGPRLAAQTLKAGSARMLYEQDARAAGALLSELESDIEATLAEIRRLVYDLRPPALDELGLVGAIRETAERHASHAADGLRVSVQAPRELPPLSAAVEVAAYRIVQEALANVTRHARATNCAVRLWVASELELEVSDDGIGIPADHHSGVGLHSMRERAEELGGSCVVGRAPTGGTRVSALLPLPDRERLASRT